MITDSALPEAAIEGSHSALQEALRVHGLPTGIFEALCAVGLKEQAITRQEKSALMSFLERAVMTQDRLKVISDEYRRGKEDGENQMREKLAKYTDALAAREFLSGDDAEAKQYRSLSASIRNNVLFIPPSRRAPDEDL